MRQISFALTTPQVRAGTKRVTRRLGWATLTPGTPLQGVEKGQGLKKGETVTKLDVVMVLDVRREPLRRMTDEPEYGQVECILEGFPEMTPAEFVAMFCEHNGCTPETVVTRIEFEKARASA